jgi:integrase
MGYIYQRGERLWIGYWDRAKQLQQQATGLKIGQEPAARDALSKIMARIDAGDDVDEMLIGPINVRRYAEHWTKLRLQQGVASCADDHTRIRLHALPSIGHLLIGDVRPRHIRDLVRSLRAKGRMAPRSIRHVYGALHTMFRDAVVDELITANPCILKRGELPKLIDKDPTWRAGAVFTRGELEQLISDERIPPDRRVLYALLGIAGLRFGEAAALRWRCYDTTLEPLGRLLIATSWCTSKRTEKSTKTEQPRQVPVHPTLAKMLAAWKLGAWQVMMGRAAGPDDLIIPSRRGRNRSRHHSLEKFREDLDRLMLRRRRQHDLRRTFISLARADGARRDVLETVTHGARGDILDMYTTLPWASVCEEVAKLKIRLVGGKVLAWPGQRAGWTARRAGEGCARLQRRSAEE